MVHHRLLLLDLRGEIVVDLALGLLGFLPTITDNLHFLELWFFLGLLLYFMAFEMEGLLLSVLIGHSFVLLILFFFLLLVLLASPLLP